MSYSRFQRCDLQVHTVADANQKYGDFGGREPSRKFAEQLIEAHVKAGVEVIAVTDHNRIDWYPLLSQVGVEKGVFVFPGVEISVNGCHLIAIWERSDSGFQLGKQFIQSLWAPGTAVFTHNQEPVPVGSGQVLDIAGKAVEHQALVIAPHSTMKKMGLFGTGVCSNASEIAQSGLIAAFDVVGNNAADVLINPRVRFGNSQPTWISTSDSRNFEDVGKRSCFLKLNSPPTLEGLRQAFLAPTSRVRFGQENLTDWQKVSGSQSISGHSPTWPYIKSVDIKGGFHNDLRVEFGPGLNAIIGGKGTGKSTLIEILRYVLNATPPIKQYQSDLDGNRTSNFRANAEAEVAFLSEDNDTYIVKRTGAAIESSISRGVSDQVDPSLVSRRAPIRLFGQRELQSYAKEPSLRREFVSWHAGIEWEAANSQHDQYQSQLDALESLISGLESRSSQLPSLRERLADLDERLARAKERGVASLFEESASLEQSDTSVNVAFKWLDRLPNTVDAFSSHTEIPSIPADLSISEKLTGSLNRIQVAVGKATAHVLDALATETASLESSKTSWTTHVKEERLRIMRELADAGFQNISELSENQRNAADIQKQIDLLLSAESSMNSNRKSFSEVVQKLEENSRRRSRLMETATRSLSDSVGSRVRVRTEPLADSSALFNCIQQNVRGIRKDQIGKLCNISPSSLAKAIRKGLESVIQSTQCSHATATQLLSISEKSIRSIERVQLSDNIVIEINVGHTSDTLWIDIDHASPGQRATAMLSLALSSGTEPLIIDQPEDDLDNRYIYEEVVKTINSVCNHRQVIVATHNANIPVLGDAEFIVALDAVAETATILASGALEDLDVSYHVRHILEGGDEAFRARQNRYQST